MAHALQKCHFDSYAQVFASKVIACTESKQEEKVEEAGGKKKKKKTNSSNAPKIKQPRFEVILEDSILFAEGGGQPTDKGTIDNVQVESVRQDEQGRVVHITNAALDVGASVDMVVDWKRRYDHMQQHTAQHLISAVARKMFGMDTISWWLAGGQDNECQIELDCKKIDQVQLDAIAAEANRVVQQGIQMQVHTFKSLEEAKKHSYFQKPENALPEEFAGDMRVVEIPGNI